MVLSGTPLLMNVPNAPTILTIGTSMQKRANPALKENSHRLQFAPTVEQVSNITHTMWEKQQHKPMQ